MASVIKNFITPNIKVICSDGIIYTNKNLLCMFSAYFERVYFSNFKKQEDTQLLEFKKETFEHIIKLLCNEKVKITTIEQYQNIQDLLQYLDINLICEKYFYYNISYEVYRALNLPEEDYKCVDGPINRGGIKVTPQNVVNEELRHKFGYSVSCQYDCISTSFQISNKTRIYKLNYNSLRNKYWEFECSNINVDTNLDRKILSLNFVKDDISSLRYATPNYIKYSVETFCDVLYIISIYESAIAYLWKQ